MARNNNSHNMREDIQAYFYRAEKPNKMQEKYEHHEEMFIKDNLAQVEVSEVNITLLNRKVKRRGFWRFLPKKTMTSYSIDVVGSVDGSIRICDAVISSENTRFYVIAFRKNGDVCLAAESSVPVMIKTKMTVCVLSSAFAEGDSSPR